MVIFGPKFLQLYKFIFSCTKYRHIYRQRSRRGVVRPGVINVVKLNWLSIYLMKCNFELISISRDRWKPNYEQNGQKTISSLVRQARKNFIWPKKGEEGRYSTLTYKMFFWWLVNHLPRSKIVLLIILKF